jgi:hypothetical protein
VHCPIPSHFPPPQELGAILACSGLPGNTVRL